jgi:hypothetical protein
MSVRLPRGEGFTTAGAAPVVVSPKDETHEIRTVAEWLEWAGPLRGEYQWKPGRSAMEVAKAWCGDAKADEPFDAPVAERVSRNRRQAAIAERSGKEWRSALLPRIALLSRALFGMDAFLADGEIDPAVGRVPYQLLAGAAGTLIEARARGAEQAAFVVHAFESEALDRTRVAANNDGFRRFVAALPGDGADDSLEVGRLRGPSTVPGAERVPSVPLFVGIAVTQLAP